MASKRWLAVLKSKYCKLIYVYKEFHKKNKEITRNLKDLKIRFIELTLLELFAPNLWE